MLGGTLYATSGGLVTSAVVSQGGFIGVFAGGTSLGATVFLDAEQSVNGVAVDTTLSGGAQDVNSGGVASGTIL